MSNQMLWAKAVVLLLATNLTLAKDFGEEIVEYSYANKKKKVDVTQKISQAMASIAKPEQYKSKNIIRLEEIKIGEGRKRKLKNFEVRFFDSLSDYQQDFGTGEAKIKSKLSSGFGIRSVKVSKNDYVPVIFDLVLENDFVLNNLITIKDEDYKKLLIKEEIKKNNSSVIIELDEMTEDVELGAYEKKIYLNQAFNKVNHIEQNYYYVMFLGVPSGNNVINYRRGMNERYTKVIGVQESSIFFDSNFYEKINIDKISFKLRNVLGKDKIFPVIDEKTIKPFSYSTNFKKISQNTLQLKNKKIPLGTRLYFEVGKNDKLYFGLWNKNEVELPSDDFISFVSAKLNKMKGNCIVQLNLPKAVYSFDFAGRSENGHMYISSYSLDSDGQIFDDVGSNTEKIFVKGEGTGIINIKISYLDKTEDYLQTYCTENSYMVEQL